MTYDDSMELKNVSIFDAFQLFLPQLIPKAAESLAMLCMMKLCTKSSHFFFFFFMNGNTERAQCALSRVCIP